MPPIRQNNFINTQAEPVKELEAGDPFRTLGIIFFITTIILSLASYGVLFVLKKQNEKIELSIRNIEDSLSSIPLDEMLGFYSKTKYINNILSSHNYMTTQLRMLSDSVQDNVYFKNFSFSSKDKDGDKLTLSASTNDEENIVKQIDVFQSDRYKKLIKKAELKAVSKDSFGELSFDIEILLNATIKPEDFILEKIVKNNRLANTKVQGVSNLSISSTTVATSTKDSILSPQIATSTNKSNN